MEIASSQSLPRIWRLALVGVFTAFAWIVLSLLFGFGSPQAQADDGEDDSLLGAVTSVVDTTASTAGTVATVTETATETVNTAVAVVPAPAQQPVRDVVSAVGAVAEQTTTPAADVVSGGVVGSVAEPVVDVVAGVPVVGAVVTDTGAADAVTDLGKTVDRTLGEVAGAVTDTGAELGNPPPEVPRFPGIPGLPASPVELSLPVGGHLLPALDVVLPVDAAHPAAAGAASALLAFLAAYAPGSAATASALPSSATSIDDRGHFTPAGGLCPPSALSSGPGGTGPGAWALVALGPIAALRAWVRRVGPEDENAPPAPAASTDVSPD